MSLMTSFTATPSRVEAVLGTCAALGGGVSRVELEALIRPKSLSEQADDDNKSDALMKEVVGECRQLGLLSVEGAEVKLTDAGLKASADLRSVLMPVLTDIRKAETSGQLEFPLLLSWLLMRDPFAPELWGNTPLGEIKAALQVRPDVDKVIPRNAQAFQQFHYWARYLGFSSWVEGMGSTVVLSSPVGALRYAIHHGGLAGHELTAKAFVDEISKVCPVLDQGTTREEVERGASQRSYQYGESVSSSLGTALLTLAKAGEIELSSIADADRLVIFGAPKVSRPEVFSHVKVS